MRKKLMAVAILACSSFGLPTIVLGDTVTFAVQKDAMIFGNSSNGDTGNSSGIGPGMFAGADGSLNKKRSLMQFDIASHVPAGAQVTNVSLTLILGQIAGAGTGGTGSNIPSRTIALFDVLQPWGEGNASGGGVAGNPTQTNTSINGGGQGSASNAGDSSWIFSLVTTPAPSETGVSWPAGGNISGTASASQTLTFPYNATTNGAGAIVAGSQYTWSGPGMITDVQNWLDNPSTNNGWMLRALTGIDSSSNTVNLESTTQSFLGFWTKDGAAANGNSTIAPMLTVTFTPEPGSLSLLLLAAPLTLRRRQRQLQV